MFSRQEGAGDLVNLVMGFSDGYLKVYFLKQAKKKTGENKAKSQILG